jgi:hypothetical protein
VIVWSNPVALAGLMLLSGPVVVHLLLRHRAPRIRFPSLRFVRASRPAAVRLRLPSDTVLLLIRLAIVALAVCALAQPLLFTRARASAWNARTARAVVVDSSESMRPLESLSAEAARAERGSAAFTFEIADGDLGKGMLRAADALRHAPPARGEIVVVSDFQWGSIRPSDLKMIPPEIGLRFIRVGTDGMKRRAQAVSVVGATADQRQEFELSPDMTGFPVVTSSIASEGLMLRTGQSDARAVAALHRVIAKAGSPAPSPAQPMTVVMAGGNLPADVRPLKSGWMLETAARLQTDSEVANACAEAEAQGSAPASGAWQVLFRDRNGRPFVSAASANESLLLDVAAPPAALVSAAVVYGALSARQGSVARPEDEIHRLSTADLNSFARPAAAVDVTRLRRDLPTDARWFWIGVLLLLGLEAFVRRERDAAQVRLRADAA